MRMRCGQIELDCYDGDTIYNTRARFGFQNEARMVIEVTGSAKELHALYLRIERGDTSMTISPKPFPGPARSQASQPVRPEVQSQPARGPVEGRHWSMNDFEPGGPKGGR